jgi:hypothetical protein
MIKTILRILLQTSKNRNEKETTAKLLKRKKIINCGAFIVMQ